MRCASLGILPVLKQRLGREATIRLLESEDHCLRRVLGSAIIKGGN
jgi:hypothetical protein